jgi:hypothetical protein
MNAKTTSQAEGAAAPRPEGRVVMARLVPRGEDDRSFDLDFWSAVGAEGRFAAAWQMVKETLLIRGEEAHESRLQRSVLCVQRR